jgi:P4 family phage/plasmid primase-like protien
MSWASACQNFDGAGCAELWYQPDRSDGPALTMRSVELWAAEDSPVEYALLPKVEVDHLEALIMAASSGTHADVAAVFYAMYPGIFCYIDKKTGWYRFKQRWFADGPECLEICRLINGPLYEAFVSRAVAIEARAEKGGGVAMALRAVAKACKSTGTRNNVIEQLKSLYFPENKSRWIAALDGKTHLLGLEDGLYDFKTKQYRPQTPADMITMSTGHLTSDVSVVDAAIEKRILDFHNDILGAAESEYLQSLFGYIVAGTRERDKFQIFTGRGRNGKGLLKVLWTEALGEYSYEPKSVVFMSRSISGSVLSSELHKMKGKRLAISSEIEARDTLAGGLMKELTGGDKNQSRTLYGEAIESKCTANIVMLCNEMPGVDDESEGFALRLEVMNFGNIYKIDPTLPHEKMIDTSLRGMFETFGAQMLRMAINRYHLTGHEFSTPAAVKETSHQFLSENSIIELFVGEYYEVTQNYSDKVSLGDMHLVYLASPYKTQLNLPRRTDLSGKLRLKGYKITTPGGYAYIRNIRLNQ